MLRVALTGGLGSGKTTAASIFRELGCAVSQSDEVARAMMQPREPIYAATVQHFGPGVLNADGTLNRAALAEIAFTHGRVDELNAIVHPLVIARQNEWMRSLESSHPQGVAMVESALVFETRYDGSGIVDTTGDRKPWRARFDRVVLVTAPESLRVERHAERQLAWLALTGEAELAAARNAAREDAQRRMRQQMPDAEKAPLADFVIVNDHSLETLRAGVVQVWCALSGEASGEIPQRTVQGGRMEAVRDASVKVGSRGR